MRHSGKDCAPLLGPRFLWKQFVAHLVRIELEGEKFDATQVWAPAWARLEKKILALKFKVNEIKRRAESRGEQTPDLSKRSKNITPIATISLKLAQALA